MRWTPKLLTCLAIFLTTLLVIPQQAKAKKTGEPEMVWVSYAVGEVKFSPGHKGKPLLGDNWMQAAPGQTMEEGYSLATEKGRAEVEFENGTMVYLAESSVLEFIKLQAKGEATEAEVNLLTGTATIAHVSRGQDVIQVETPSLRMGFAGNETVRLESTLNGMVIKSVEGEVPLHTGVSEGEEVLSVGESAAYVAGDLLPVRELKQSTVADEWDHWVNGRRAERRALLEQGLKESGLQKPIPGLAGMAKTGTFYDCEPYGKCWEPNEMAGQTEAQTAQASLGASGNGQTSGGTRKPNIVVNYTMMSRCPMETWMVSERNALAPNGQPRRVAGQTIGETNEVEYGTCFAGSWLHHRRWVAGRRHKHSCHFVKVGRHQIGIVPRHPLDQKGKPPVNAKSEILVLAVEKGRIQAGVQPVPTKGVHVVASVPRGVERGLVESAPRVAQPVIQARVLEDVAEHGSQSARQGSEQKTPTVIRYDYKTRNFVASGKTERNERAEVIAHVGSNARGVDHVEMGGRGSPGGSGGGSHESSGGGSSHSGGSPSTSSAAASTSAAASSSGGGHH
jgi:uncharacterized membrane protein YgcG